MLLFVAVKLTVGDVPKSVAKAVTVNPTLLDGFVIKLLSTVTILPSRAIIPKPSLPPAPNGSPPLLLNVLLLTSTIAFLPRTLIARFKLFVSVQLSTTIV